jgi:predicted nucleic acid-binding protein
MRHIFLDTSYAIALSVQNDLHHARALILADDLETTQTRLVTTFAVLLEIGNALAKARYRQAAIALLHSLETDPQIEIVPFSKELYARALNLYTQRPDKEWGLTDCLSFVVMQDRQMTEALTADEHFGQAGFSPLLR